MTLQALLNAAESKKDWPGIFGSTAGLVFFGTPFRGCEGLSQAEMVEAAYLEYDPDMVQQDILQVLQPGNDFLQDLMDKFGRLRAQSPDLMVACFYELKSTNVGRIVGGKDRIVSLLTFLYTEPRAKANFASDLLWTRSLAVSISVRRRRNTHFLEPTLT
jgi:hypothetical protein